MTIPQPVLPKDHASARSTQRRRRLLGPEGPSLRPPSRPRTGEDRSNGFAIPIVRVIVVGVLATVLAACSIGQTERTSGPVTQPTTHTSSISPQPTTHTSSISPQPAATRSAATSTAAVHVAGLAVDSDGDYVSGAVVGLRLTRDADRTHLTRSGSDGTFQLALAAGTYLVGCVADLGDCSVWHGNQRIERIELTHSIDDLTLEIDLPAGGTPDDRGGEGADRTGGGAPEPAGVSGVATMPDGTPAIGVTIEFKQVGPCNGCSQPATITDQSGRYTLKLPEGSYNAMCIVDDDDYNCGPVGGDGGPFLVDVPPARQRVDFIVCTGSDYPACLVR